MIAVPTGFGKRCTRAAVLLVLAGWSVQAWANDLEFMKKADEPDPPAKKADEPKPVEKTYKLNFDRQPWMGDKNSVIEWLSDETGLPISASNVRPQGTVTLISPKDKGKVKEYTLSEVIELLNNELSKQNMMILRRSNQLTLQAADTKFNANDAPRAKLDELDKYGKSEVVQVIMPLKTQMADEMAIAVKDLLGPFGQVVAMKPNQLVMTDKVENLKRAIDTLKDIDGEGGQVDSYSHKCLYVRPREAERILRDLFGMPQQTTVQPTTGSRDPREYYRDPREYYRGDPREYYRGDSRTPTTPTASSRPHYITVDDAANKVIVVGPPNVVSKAKELLTKDIDVAPGPDAKIRPGGPPELRTYPVAAGTAGSIADTLNKIYKSNPTVTIAATSDNRGVMVYATPADHFDINKIIKGSVPESDLTVKRLPVRSNPTDVASTLKNMFADPSAKPGAASSGPYIEGDAAGGSVIVKGTAQQVADVEMALKQIGELGELATNSKSRTIMLPQGGSATALAEELERLLRERGHPVQMIIPGREKKPEPPKDKDKDKDGKDKSGDGKQTKNDTPRDDSRLVAARQIVDPQEKKAPVTIMAAGNRLTVESDDPKVVAFVTDLIRLVTTTQATEGDFQYIPLKNANAAEAAKVLDELFNGPKQPVQQPQRGRGGFPFAPAAPEPAAGGAKSNVRIVADTGTNSLLVKASPIDMLTVRRYLREVIDTGAKDSRAVIKTWPPLRLKNARAVDVAAVLRDVYREHMNNNPQNGTLGGFPGLNFTAFGGGGLRGGGGANRNVDASGNPRAVTLSIGVDDQTNSLVMQCNEAMHEDIVALVGELEKAAADSVRTVKVVPVKGVDPLLIQQAIDAFQGRTTARPNMNGFNGASGAGSQFGGLRGGGGSSSRGGGGGFFPSGGGGVFPGGGGQGPPGSYGGGRSRSDSRGPDFFAERVKDDPEPSVLYDPQLDYWAANEANHVGQDRAKAATPPEPVRQVKHEEQQQPPTPPVGGGVVGPRSDVTIEALPEIGAVIINARNPADLQAVLDIIEQLRKIAAEAEVVIQLVPMEHADATSVTNLLNQLFSRVTVGPNSSAIIQRSTPTTTAQLPFGTITQSTQQAASVVLIPVPRFNAILVATSRARFPDVQREIRRLDQPTPQESSPAAFKLEKASAARVGQLLTAFYAQRYSPSEAANQNQIRITWDDSTNTVFVQAAPADLKQIAELIRYIDTELPKSVNDLRIVTLRYALADELAQLLLRALSEGVVAPTTGGAGGLPGGGLFPGGGGGLFPGGGGGGLFPGGGGGGLLPGGGGGGLLPGGGATGRPTGFPGQTTTGAATKTSSIRFYTTRDGRVIESGPLEDVFITPDVRTNSLIIAAPAKTMELILALIRELDVVPEARAEIKVFQLKKGDATNVATLLQQLFLGTGGAAGGLRPGGALPGGAFPGTTGTTGARPLPFSLGGYTPEGAPLIELRITVDTRTNSIIVAGSRDDLLVIEALVSRLEDSTAQDRRNTVYTLRNTVALDVANALNNFLNTSLQVLAIGQQLSAFQQIEREVVVVAEPITNKLLISASPRYYEELVRLIQEIDVEPPQVVIQVLIAEVDLTNNEEFGVEIGLQAPVFFQRTINPTGTAINTSALQFNNVTTALATSPLIAPETVAFQGLGNFGVGRLSAAQQVGGFVFSGASDSFNLLIRALKVQGRMDILSRPQVMTTDNQAATVFVGQLVPYVTGSIVSTLGTVTNTIDRQQVGVLLNVTPKINPDGRVIMRVTPTVSSVSPTLVNIGNNQTATAFNTQTVDTTVAAMDGETVVIGGLIQKRDTKNENKIPWLGDLPYVGAAFRFRTQQKSKQELLVILTPRVVRSRFDAERVLAEESRRIDWLVGDVVKAHGTAGMEPAFAAAGGGPGGPKAGGPGACPTPGPLAPTTTILSGAPPARPEAGPAQQPRIFPVPPPNLGQGQPGAPASQPEAGQPAVNPVAVAPPPQMMLPPGQGQQPPPAGSQGTAPAPEGKETGKWKLFRK